MTSKIDSEIKKFSKIANHWWKDNGKFKVLHQFNNARIEFIEKHMVEHLDSSYNKYNLLDVGCGGGILCEPFSKKGFNVVGIDASEETISEAKKHALDSNLNIQYFNTTPEELKSTYPNVMYDVIFAMEIIEHVKDPLDFVLTLSSLLNPNGLIFFSTINRNIKSLLLAKISAEYVLNWIPKGTHDYNKFITPRELKEIAKVSGITTMGLEGINFNIIKNIWTLGKNSDVNYIMCGKKII